MSSIMDKAWLHAARNKDDYVCGVDNCIKFIKMNSAKSKIIRFIYGCKHPKASPLEIKPYIIETQKVLQYPHQKILILISVSGKQW